jgi:DNA polymerase-3 subunit delta
LRGLDKACETIVKKTIQDERTRQALLIVEATALKPASALRKTFEKTPDLASIACFEDDGKSLGQVLDEELINSKISISADARALLISQLGSDRALSRSEIEKLCLYSGPNRRIELADIEAISGDTSTLTLDLFADNAGSGNLGDLDTDYQRAVSSGIQPSSILMNVTRHFSRLHFIHSNTRSGQSMSSLVARLRPPLHFKRRDMFIRQLNRWNEPHLRKALKILKDTEHQCRSSHVSVETLVNRALLQISTLAMSSSGSHQK